MYRIVKGTVLEPTGQPSKGLVKFDFSGSFDSTAQYPRKTIQVKLDPEGKFITPLWVNEIALTTSKYICTLPGGDAFEFVLPIGVGEIDLGEVRDQDLPYITPYLLYLHNNDPNAHNGLVGGGSETPASIIADVDITGSRIISVNSIGRAVYADSSTVATANSILGISINSALTGNSLNYKSIGRFQEPSWNWEPGENIFVGSNGQLTQTPPSSGYVLSVGVAVSDIEIQILIGKPIFR